MVHDAWCQQGGFGDSMDQHSHFWANLSWGPLWEVGKVFFYKANGCEMTEGARGDWVGGVDSGEGC